MSVRERRDIPHEEIAEAVGVSAAAYSRWEKGQRVPREEDVRKLAAFFGVTPAYLRYGVAETQTPHSEEQGARYHTGNTKPVDPSEIAAERAGKAAKSGTAKKKGG